MDCLTQENLILYFLKAFPIAIIFVLAWVFFKIKKYYLGVYKERIYFKKTGLNLRQLDTLNKVTTVLACFTLIIFLLHAFGYDASVLLTIGGIGGAFVGFATKDFIANFFGGLVIYLTHPFTLRDYIKLPGHNIDGQVDEIGWYLTKIIDGEKQPVYIPNSMFSHVILITPSMRSHHRIRETIQVRPQDADKILSIIENLRKELSNIPEIDTNERFDIFFVGSDRQQLNIEVLAYTREINPSIYKRVIQMVLLKARECIVREGGKIPAATNEIDVISPLNVILSKQIDDLKFTTLDDIRLSKPLNELK